MPLLHGEPDWPHAVPVPSHEPFSPAFVILGPRDRSGMLGGHAGWEG